jgi:glycosyltransferase involved in cell wall biosynthesis
MQVGIDVSPLALTRAGTARHLNGLLPHLEAMPDLDVRRLSWGGPGRATAVARDVWWYLGALPRRARRLDVLHCPSFRAPLRSPVPLVVTVHDLAVLRHPEVFNRWSRTYGRALVPRVVRAADRVIAVSEFTRRELVELVGVDEDRIRVVPNAVDAPFGAEGAAAAGDYVLAVGTIEPRKNLARLFEAMRGVELELRLVGERGWGESDVVVQLHRFRSLGRVSDETLASLYRGARVFVYPSLYEGFGLPVLEAMASGTPVVTSRGGALEELTGGAAVVVDPLDPSSIRAGIEEALARADELRAAGLDRARRFSWRASAEATADVYRELA